MKYDPNAFQTGRLKNYTCDGQLSFEDLEIDFEYEEEEEEILDMDEEFEP